MHHLRGHLLGLHAEIDAPVDGPVPLLHQQLPALLDHGGGELLRPQRRDLHRVAVPFGAPREGVARQRGLVAPAPALEEVPSQHRGARQVHELRHGGQRRGHLRKVLGDGLGHADHGVPLVGARRVHVAALAGHELPRVHAELAVRHQRAVLRHGHAGPADHEPLPRGTAAALLLLGPGALAVEEAGEARELPVAHADLLQLVVGLEEHLTHARASKPSGLEALLLHGVAVGGVHWIQGEKRLPALQQTDLHGQCQVLQVHRRRRLHGRHHACHALTIKRQAAEAKLRRPGQLLSKRQRAGDAFGLPPDVVLRTARLLRLRRLLLLGLRLRPEATQGELRKALAMRQSCTIELEVPQGQAAVAAQAQALAIGVLHNVVVLGHNLL
mmetsp:Transcript_55092/g.172734  ORF Transcript_55092/g.172734 Transcript_55092/m.172734 type:complete len:385 (-) Transcript_55092:551-1705(-)